MRAFMHNTLKQTFTTRAVPALLIDQVIPFVDPPRLGDLVVAKIASVGQHTVVDNQAGVAMRLAPDDIFVGAFGACYATHQYEGHVPPEPVDQCDLLSNGGVCGIVVAQHATMGEPTRLQVLGGVGSPAGQLLNMRQFDLSRCPDTGVGTVILIAGSATNVGKTTTAGALIYSLSRAGKRVAAARVTGTARSRDVRFFANCGACLTLDFTDAGYPSTYTLDDDALLDVYHSLLAHLRATHAEFLIVEISDGLLQRETRFLLKHPGVLNSVDHVFFAANDSVSAVCGAQLLMHWGLPLRAITGALTQSPLAIREVETAVGAPCWTDRRLMSNELESLVAAKEHLSCW